MVGVRVETRESCELLFSLAAFSEKKFQVATDLRTDWLRWVSKRLSADLSSAFSEAGDFPLERFLWLAMLCPAHDSTGYLRWLTSPAVPQAPSTDGWPKMTSFIRLLELWHEEYYRAVDPAIPVSLQDDVDKMNHLMLTSSPEDIIEYATQGWTLTDSLTSRPVVLVPQYHCRPWSIMISTPDVGTVIFYAADGLPLWGQNAPVRLPRLARAFDDPIRVQILNLLKSGPKRFTDIVQYTGASKSAMSYHMTMLRAAGLLSVLVDEWGAKQFALRGQCGDLASEAFSQFFGVKA